jgi:outer membrane protein assembly factor BamE (lipoprotein component of BamABCDE complex)
LNWLQSKAKKVCTDFERFAKVDVSPKIVSHQTLTVQFSKNKIPKKKTQIQDFQPIISFCTRQADV